MSNHDREGSRPSLHDDALERAWRDASNEQPPAQIDVAIVAAARQAVPDSRDQPGAASVRGRSRNWLARWQPVAAAATVAGLAFVLVQTLPRDPDFSPQLQREESISTPASAETSQPADPAPAAAAVPPPPAARTPLPEPAPPMAQGAVAPTDSAAPSAAGASSVAESRAKSANRADSTEDAENREAMQTEIAPRSERPAVAASSAPARERSPGLAAPRDPAEWAASIESQYLAGNITGAADALRAFRATDPDADRYLAEPLREWARTVE